MYSTKIVRNIDNLGRFKLPSRWLELNGIMPNSRLKLTRGKARIVIEPEVHKCIFCFSSENIHIFREKFICSKCASKIGHGGIKKH